MQCLGEEWSMGSPVRGRSIRTAQTNDMNYAMRYGLEVQKESLGLRRRTPKTAVMDDRRQGVRAEWARLGMIATLFSLDVGC
jgi:hypothetical protein